MSAADDENRVPSLVLGTAGHIDHGKTALVRALTGQDLDRLPEEQARGITIELGFVPLDLADDLRVALIDVPGHEKFVRTMVAGATGLDLVMLIVAADEGVMPQTREHLAICELLGIDRGLVVLTKSDLVDEEMIELATEEIRDALSEGPLAEIPILTASALTLDGIDRVRATLETLVRETPVREDDARPPRMFIDRSFTKHGFGAVATGTWSGQPLSVGDAAVLEPGGRKARIRGIERHGESTETTESGARIALNLQGVSTDEIHRGDLLTAPSCVISASVFDVSLRWMARATELDAPFSVEFLSGTAERRARIARIGEMPIEPGTRGFARIHIEGAPLALLPGDRFVVRGFSREAGVGATVGGGQILDIMPPHRRRRDPTLLGDLTRLASRDDRVGAVVRISRAGLTGMPTKTLSLEMGISQEQLDRQLETQDADGEIVRLESAICFGREAIDRLEGSLLGALDEYHRREPLQPGTPRARLAGVLPENVPTGVGALLIDRLAARGAVLMNREIVTRAGFQAALDAKQQAVADRLASVLREAALDPPSLKTVGEDLSLPESELRALAHHLDRTGVLVAAPDGLFFDRESVTELIDRVVASFESSKELDTQTLKAMIGTSRRTAMPLMALLDDLQITRRDGSLRRLINKRPNAWATSSDEN